MKRILSFLFMTILSLTIAYGQNSKGGSNFYLTSGLSGRVLPALGAPGGTALVYVDDAFSDDKVVSELTSAGYTVTVASSASDFNTRIAGGGWSLVVLFNQNYYINSSGLSFTAVQNYVNGGGLMIFLSWDSANSESWANLFGAHYTGNNNNNTLTITDPVISNGITNPIILTNPSWLIGFSVGLSALSGSEVLGTFGNG
ncbi:MAG: hypothetical protein KA807_04400, partial [Prolixibacteraceae bacterium]|nr:hypothetical protein [Prolixibacteraceae bacterium]